MVTIKKGKPMYAIEDMHVFELVADEDITFENWDEVRQYVLRYGKQIERTKR